MKKVLIIACYFPPEGGGGVQRTTKFVKYLPQFGWKPIVLTSKKHILQVRDDSLLDDIPYATKIVRTKSWEPIISKMSWNNLFIRILSIPDLSIWWIPFAILEGLNQIKKEHIDVIYVTGNPFSSYLIGCFLKCFTKKPLVIDFRDAWILDPRRSVRLIMQWRNLIEKIQFELSVKYSNKVILATNSMKDDFQLHFTNIKHRKDFISITNGFDEDDFEKSEHIKKNLNFLSLVYTGSLQEGTRNPEYLFKALHLIKATQPDVYKQIKLYLVGSVSNTYVKLINEYSLDSCIICSGYLSHYESLGYLEMADALVFIMEVDKNVRQITSGKIFEYIAFEKPILALAHHDSDAADIIKESNLGIFANPIDERDIMDKLINLHNAWKNKIKIVHPSTKNINNYTREKMTEKLALILNDI